MNQFHFHTRAAASAGRRQRTRAALLCVVFLAFGVLAPSFAASAERLVVYSGRAERLIKPVLDAFEAKTGVKIELLSSGTTELVNRLAHEGPRTQADVFLTNDAGSLERARELKLLAPLSLPSVSDAIPAAFRATDNSWIGLSGRLWVPVYNTKLLKPADVSSILDLADPRWKGKIAIPNSGSEYLQAGVSVMKAALGDDKTKEFLAGLKANAGTQVYQKSSQIVDAVAKGEVALGIVNHYYVFRYLGEHPGAPIGVIVPDQSTGAMGAIINVSGVGIVAGSRHMDAAKRLVEFLASVEGQKMFAELNKEYPLRPGVPADPALPDRGSFRTAGVPLTSLSELREPAMALIEQVGLR
jgi:iron(III) transport system substrate-binding protein